MCRASHSIRKKILRVTLLLVLFFDMVASTNDDGPTKPTVNIDFGKNVSHITTETAPLPANLDLNDVTSSTASPSPSSSTSSKMLMMPNTDDVKHKVTISSTDNNDNQSMKRAFDRFNEKIEQNMNIYSNEMSFLTKKLNNLKDKLNTLEILNHEIDQVMNRLNAVDQKLQVMQEAMFGSQSINGKLDRLEVSVQQFHVRIDELMENQRKSNPKAMIQTQYKNSHDDPSSDNAELFRNCDSKMEQLVGFVHSFAELNRLESSDILNRLGHMQSQLIQFFDTKQKISSNQFNQRNTIESNRTSQELENVDKIAQLSNHLNDTNTFNSTDVMKESELKISTQMLILPTTSESTLLNLTDDRKLSISNGKSIRKRKRMTNMRKRAKRNHKDQHSFQVLHLENSKRSKIVYNTTNNIQHNFTSNSDNSNVDIEINYSVIKSDKQVSAKYGQPTPHGCHEFFKSERIDEIHRFTLTNGVSERLCSFDGNGAGWTVIQSRGHLNSESIPENFNRSWNEYRYGFGNLSGEFWYGNDLIHKLTYDDDMELKIVLETWDNRSMEFLYDIFRIDSEKNRYNLFVDKFMGNDTSLDALAYHHNQDFSTFDRQNDKSGINDSRACCSCAKSYASGWWFRSCMETNLNGVYRFNPLNNNYVGIIWEKWLGDYSLKSSKMMIRPKVNWSSTTRNDDLSKKPPDDP